jgi:hypothetical protein
MPAKRKPVRYHGTVSTKIAGKIYRGAYMVSGQPAEVIVVLEGTGGPADRTKITQLSDSPAAGLARIMLREMVEVQIRRKSK